MNQVKVIFQMDFTQLYGFVNAEPCKSQKYVSYISSLFMGLLNTALQS